YALDALGNRYSFGRCVHGEWDFANPRASFGGSYSGSTLTLKANRRDLGGTSRFDFRIGAAAITGSGPVYDFAPDVGTTGWNYQVVAPPQAAMKPPAPLRGGCLPPPEAPRMPPPRRRGFFLPLPRSCWLMRP